jgi:polyisoprenoid-binding protein YceI
MKVATETAVKTKWTIDKAHSEIQFIARHLMIAKVKGHFKDYDATVEMMGSDLTNSKVHFTAKTNSLTTGNAQRDEHLRRDDFFSSDKFPELTFFSTSVDQKGENNYTLSGILTIRDISKPITVHVTFEGMAKDTQGRVKAGFQINGKINRKDFGLNWNALTEDGGTVLGDEIKISCSVELQLEKP